MVLNLPIMIVIAFKLLKMVLKKEDLPIFGPKRTTIKNVFSSYAFRVVLVVETVSLDFGRVHVPCKNAHNRDSDVFLYFHHSGFHH